MSGNILILGSGGQVGRALVAQLGARAIALPQEEADMRDPAFIKALAKHAAASKLLAVINAAAYTAVDKAEGEGQVEAMRINAEAVGELAAWCKQQKLPLVHYSTDYVFNGSGSHARREDEPVAPLNMYGKSKLAGEKALASQGGDWLLFRTSWVYDAHGQNFFNTMLRLFGEKDSLNVVSDQVGAPTYAPHLAKATIAALDKALAMKSFPTGIYHLCGAGETSWYEFASAIFNLARSRDSGQKSHIRCQRINPILSSDYPVPAARPLNSRLDCVKAKDILGVTLPRWQQGLEECFEAKYGRTGLKDQRPQDRPAKGSGG